MKKNWLFILVGGICLICAIISICCTYPRIVDSTKDKLGLDYLGIIVGILAFMLALIISFQVYNALELNNKLKKIDCEFKKQINDIECATKAFIAYNNAQSYIVSSLSGEIKGLFYAMENEINSSHKVVTTMLIKDIAESISKLQKENIKLEYGTKDKYLIMLDSYKGENAQKLRAYIKSLEEDR